MPAKAWGRRILTLLLLASVLVPFDARPAHAEEASDTPVYLPVLGQRMCTGVVTPDLFGVQIYGATSRDSEFFADLKDSQATWVRVPVAWRNIEPVNTDPANFLWVHADNALAAANDGCINIIATHRWNPSWAAAKPDGPIRAEHLDELADYLAALVERYDGDGIDDAPGSPIVRYWELYNEPDAIRDYGGWGSDPERYAEMLAYVRPRIWQASHEAKVLLGGLAYDWFTDAQPRPGNFNRAFLSDVAKAGGGDYFDIMNFHYFPDFADNWASYGPGLVGKTRAIQEEMGTLGLKQTKIMVTESGHYVRGGSYPSSEELHLRYVPVIYTQAKAEPDIQNVILFSLNDLDSFPQDTGLVERLIYPPYSRRRTAFRAYQVAKQQLAAARYQRQLDVQETGDASLEVHRLYDPVGQHVLYVAWRNPVSTDESAPLFLPGGEATVRNVFGESRMVRDAGDGSVDGQIRVFVSGLPVYIEIQ